MYVNKNKNILFSFDLNNYGHFDKEKLMLDYSGDVLYKNPEGLQILHNYVTHEQW